MADNELQSKEIEKDDIAHFPLEARVIVQADCLATLKGLPDCCCDIFTDPPYNVGKDYGPVSDKRDDYESWISEVLTECKRVAYTLTVYIPKKWNLLYRNVLGTDFQEIMLPFRPAGALRYGFSNQYNSLLTNSRPQKGKPILNVWDNMQQPGLGFFFREETYGYDGYTSQAITRRVICELCESDIIFDPFMGTGTTAVAALKEGKKWSGTELNPQVIEIANKRIDEFTRQPELAL